MITMGFYQEYFYSNLTAIFSHIHIDINILNLTTSITCALEIGDLCFHLY